MKEHMEEWESRHPGPGEAYLKRLDRNGRVRYAHPKGYQWLQERKSEELNKRLEIADRGYEFQWANWKPLAREESLVDDWAILSPVTNYQVLAYQLARTSLSDRLRFGRLGREYRQTFISYLRGKGAFTSRRWFSDDADMPKFGGRWKRSLGESIEAMTPGLAVLLLTFAASVMVTLMRFLTYDPR